MPAPLPCDWNSIATLAASGVTLEELSARFGISLSTLKSRSSRGNWKKAGKDVQQQRIATAVMAGQMSPIAAQGVHVIRDTLAEDSKATRISLAASARKMASKLEDTADPENAGDMLQVAKTAALVHHWEHTPGMDVRIAVYGTFAEPPVIDA
ncbi:MAG: hypothetical protein WDN28_07720 [Chthoniobacter sp.]